MNTAPPVASRILVIDDNNSIHDDFRRILSVKASREAELSLDAMEAALFGAPVEAAGPREFELSHALQGEAGVVLAREALAAGRPYKMAFVDMRMPPGWDGVKTTEQLWLVDPDIQVVICTAYSDYSWDEVVSRLGHNDRLLLLKKPFDRAEVYQFASALSDKRDLVCAARAKLDGSIQMAAALSRANQELEREVAERKAVEERLRYNASHDALTGLPNRAFLMTHLESCVARAKRHSDYLFAVFFLDLDDFKFVNDSLGHEVGDQLLVHVAQRIRSVLRAEDLVIRTDGDTSARLGGDEFVVVLEGLEQASHAAVVADRLLRCLCKTVMIQNNELTINASIGITVSNHGYTRAEEVLRDADTAMYRAKQSGKSRFALFDPEMHASAKRRLELERDLRKALLEGGFSLVWQPVVEVATGAVVAVEGLIRLVLPDGQRRSPAEFIGVAEETGLIVPIGEWVIEEACRSVALLASIWPRGRDVRVNVNVSRRQLLDPRLIDVVKRSLAKYQVPAEYLGLEITESAVIDDEDAARRRLDDLKAVGVSLYLDDFGTGYSSLSCLHQFPLDVVKIDRSFVANTVDSRRGVAIVQAIVSLAHCLGMKVTSEGIETAEQLAAIRTTGCDFAQGYLFAAPLELETLRTHGFPAFVG